MVEFQTAAPPDHIPGDGFGYSRPVTTDCPEHPSRHDSSGCTRDPSESYRLMSNEAPHLVESHMRHRQRAQENKEPRRITRHALRPKSEQSRQCRQ